MILNSEEQNFLFSIIKRSIEHGFKHDASLSIDPSTIDSKFKIISSVLVILKYKNKIIGSSSIFDSSNIFYNALSKAGFKAAFRNEKYPEINKNIINDTEISFYILSDNKPVALIENIDDFCLRLKSTDSVIISCSDKKDYFLLEMQKEYENVLLFMLALRESAGIPKIIPWSYIKATTISATCSYSKLYKEITCQDSDS